MKRILRLFAMFVFCWMIGVQCDPPGKASGCKPLHGVIYDPFSTEQENMCLPVEQVIIDVEIMATVTKSIRIYSLAVCPEATMALMQEAEKHDLSVLLGVFIGESADENESELEMIETVMEEYSGVVQGIVVGNNAIITGKIGSSNSYSRVLSNVELLVEYIERVKRILKKNGWDHSVSTAEGWGVWESEHGAALAEVIDFICLEMNPYYEGFSVECPFEERSSCVGAASYANAKAEGLSQYYTKDVWVCETGWPTAGDSCCAGIPDETNEYQAIASPATASNYLYEFVDDVNGRPYYISSAFDRDWRRIWSPCPFCAEENLSLSSFEDGICNLCEHDYQLGIFDQDRERKTNYKIPEVKCSLPELPAQRLADGPADPSASEEDEAPEEEEKKNKGLSRKERLRRWRAQQRRKRKKKAAAKAEEEKEENNAASAEDIQVEDAPSNENQPAETTETEVAVTEEETEVAVTEELPEEESTVSAEEVLLEEQPDEETTSFAETTEVISE